MDVEKNLKEYLEAREPTARDSSFDYCFNHFQSHRGDPEELVSSAGLELNCLHLALYLASWGMLRGSAELLKRSIKHYAALIEVIASSNPNVWEIDADTYTDDAIQTLWQTASQLRSALPGGATDTLVTKIMLGVFGNVPAFDIRFRKGFGVSTFDLKSLLKIASFYKRNAETIEANRVYTLDFATGLETSAQYTRAKVIDMIFEGGRSAAGQLMSDW